MFEIKFDKFKGPLDLLLELIKKEKLDITEISLVHVTEQYLNYVKEIKKIAPSEVANFLLIAAKLLYLKSKVLLPEIEQEEQEEEDFLEQLKIYKEYLKASEKVNEILNKKRFLFFRKNNIKNQRFFSPPKNINSQKINQVFEGLLLRIEKNNISIEKDKIIRKISVQDKIREINVLIKKRKEFILNCIFGPLVSREEKVVSFLAILEIVKGGEIFVDQKKVFSDIVISR